jgi:hypothetical protein
VLFLVDRIPLAKQTEDAFAEHLPDYPAYVLRTGRRFQDEKRITITTLQSMVNIYGEYSSGYFDLVISDECHRSIYGKWSGVLKHFDGVQIGLTATPCVANLEDMAPDEEDKLFVRDTLRFFEVDKPTYSYKLKDAIHAGDSLILNAAHNADYVASKTFFAGEAVKGAMPTGEWLVVRPNSEVADPAFINFWLRSASTRKSIKFLVKGIHLYPKDVATLPVALPPLTEQHRIVNLLSRAEGIVRLRREAEKKAAQLIPALFLDMFGDPTANPKGWPTRPLGELVAFMSGGTPSKAREDFWEGDLPWVSPKDMKRMAITDAIDHVNRKILTETNIKLVPVGSLLIVVRGMILIHTVPVAVSRAPLTINQDMKALTPQIDANSTYLLWLMKVSQPQLLNLVSTAAHGTKKLETERLEAFLIPLPPLEAQEAFANKVAQIESIQTQQSAAFAKALSTFNALLARTFANQVQTA